MSAREVTIRCAGCGEIYAAAFIRCHRCKKPTRESRLYWQHNRPPTDKPIKWHIVIPLSVLLWGLIALGFVLAAYG